MCSTACWLVTSVCETWAYRGGGCALVFISPPARGLSEVLRNTENTPTIVYFSTCKCIVDEKSLCVAMSYTTGCMVRQWLCGNVDSCGRHRIALRGIVAFELRPTLLHACYEPGRTLGSCWTAFVISADQILRRQKSPPGSLVDFFSLLSIDPRFDFRAASPVGRARYRCTLRGAVSGEGESSRSSRLHANTSGWCRHVSEVCSLYEQHGAQQGV